MFLEISELNSAIHDYTLGQITADEVAIRSAILMAIGEMSSYLGGRYNTAAIFNATGEGRDPLILKHCKSIAVWYIIRVSNAEILFNKAKIYYDNAIDWLKQVAGVGASGKSISASLPLLTEEDGRAKIQMRMGSHRKFQHYWEDD
jgi:phage gp36-like protein